MYFLKQSTAVTLKVGHFVDATDGYTTKTALTINQADVKLSKNGGVLAQKNDTGGGTHDADGIYGIGINATDTGTLGRLKGSIVINGARPVTFEYMVLPANVYDSLVSGTANLNANVAACNTDVIDANALNATAATEIATAVGALTVESTYTIVQVLRLISAVLYGKVSGMDTNAPIFRDVPDTKNRISATVDARGNRTAITIASAT